uniref:Uncharacterized protein n=1 Tax=viral metagenome TaxID=1070528 RepID=A0A6H2A691_9ZZZZ
MSWWDGNKIVKYASQECKDYPNWQLIDCGCCSGLEWGGEYPKECKTCRGNGWIYKHKRSGVLVLYPGGPFCGKEVKHGGYSLYK